MSIIKSDIITPKNVWPRNLDGSSGANGLRPIVARDTILFGEAMKKEKKIDNFIEGSDKSMTYYTGNWATDVLNNFTEKQSEKIFKTMSKYMDNNGLQFFQKKNKNIEIGTWSEYGENEPESISSYDYIIIKKA